MIVFFNNLKIKNILLFLIAFLGLLFAINADVFANNSGFLDKNSLVVTDLKSNVNLKDVPTAIKNVITIKNLF